MKLPELKSKFKNRYAIRIIAGVLVVTLVATGSSVYSVNAAKAGSAATENVEETEVSEEAEDTEDAESSLKDLLDNGSKVSEKEIGKEETVYVIADNTGKEQKIIVSDHLINNDDKDTLEDASTLKDIENSLTEEEKEIARRGRNTQTHHIAKNASMQDYMYATAFEALIGYLYLTKQDERLKEILNI